MTITSNASLVKQVVSTGILPLKTVIASLFPLLISLFVLILMCFSTRLSARDLSTAFSCAYAGRVMMTGIAYLLSPIGAFFKDLKDIVSCFQ